MIELDFTPGPQGWQGPFGLEGIQGSQGPQGVGAQGAGFQGPQGVMGGIGLQGPQGHQGEGFQGVQGYQGTVGIQGWQGSQGLQGSQSAQGYQGYQGRQGWQGESSFAIGAARNYNVTDSYLSASEVATNIVPIILAANAKLVAMSLVASTAAAWTAEVHLGGTPVAGAFLSSGGLINAYSAAYNINFNAGDGLQIYCNGTSVNKPRVNLWFDRR